MIMPWGKHTGKEIEDLPSSYLKWLAEYSDDDDICEEAYIEYHWRSGHNAHMEVIDD
jgi:hypothetical protein